MKRTLKQAFQELPITQKAFAKYADVSQALIYKLIRGDYKNKPSERTKSKIRTAFQKIGKELIDIELIY